MNRTQKLNVENANISLMVKFSQKKESTFDLKQFQKKFNFKRNLILQNLKLIFRGTDIFRQSSRLSIDLCLLARELRIEIIPLRRAQMFLWWHRLIVAIR